MNIKPLLSLALVAALAAPAAAVKPNEWTHQTEADFAEAEAEGAVVTNLGEVQLARATEALAELQGEGSIVYDIAQLPDERVFLAVGPEGRLLRLADGAPEAVAAYPGSQVFALAVDGEGMWVGVSGAPSRLEYRAGDEMEVERTVELPETRYIWQIVVDGDRLWVATGDEGRVLAVDPDAEEPEPAIALASGQSNVLTLGIDDAGNVYAGTDTEGLIYRITPNGDRFDTFVLYDAPEPEIGALLVLGDGTVFAGTADAEQARPGRLEEAVAEERGRVDPPVDPEDPDVPEPPDVPLPPEPAPPDPEDDPLDPDDEPADPDDEPADPEPAPEEQALADLDEAGAEAPRPSADQYDELRDAVSGRLDEARRSGRIAARDTGQPVEPARAQERAAAPRAAPRRAARPARDGNAIYRIDPDGFVHEIFRESVMILRIVHDGRGLLIATGNEGQLYRYDPDAQEVTILADLDPQQVPAMFDLGDGGVLLGTANPGRVLRLSDAYAETGTLTSRPLDAEQVSLWGRLRLTALAAEGTRIEIQTRSGNVGDPELGSWSEWSDPQPVDLDAGLSAFMEVRSPNARFFQYRLVLASEGEATPVVNRFSMKYLMPNLPPRVTSITAEYEERGARRGGGRGNDEEGPQPRTTLNIEWEAADPNEDELAYTLEARPLGEPDTPYIVIADDLTDASYEWDTRRTPDGRYVLRVTASDAPDNIPEHAMTSSRRSDPVVVDNTQPEIHDFAVEQEGPDSIRLRARVTDAISPIAGVRYSLNGRDRWQLVLPEDMIYDSTEESVDVRINGLAPGTHVLTLRATDALGNARYASRTVRIDPDAEEPPARARAE